MSSEKELETFAKICSKLETFVKFVLKATPTNQQLDVIKAVDSGERYIAVKSGHGVGKSTMLSWIAIWFCLTKDDVKIPITAPSSPQLMLTLMPEIKKWINRLPKALRDGIDVKSEEIRFANNNFIALRTARKETPEALQGFHAKYLIYLIDEASGVCDEIFEVIEGALTGEENILIMVGNPTRTSGNFFNAFNKNSHLYKTFTLNAELSENVDKQTIARAKEKYGADSDAYRVRILGEFPKASSNALFEIALLDEAINRHNNKDGSNIWGLDVAEFGDDNSVLCKRVGFYVYPFLKYSNLDSEALADAICEEYNKAHRKPTAIYIDIIGVGAGVWSILLRRGLPALRADVRNKTYKEGYFNKRIEIYNRLKENMNMLSIPDDDELYGELSSLEYEITDRGLIKLESKKDTKKRLGRSPDKGDALALTFFSEIDMVDDEIMDTDNERIRMGRVNRSGMIGSIAW